MHNADRSWRGFLNAARFQGHSSIHAIPHLLLTLTSQLRKIPVQRRQHVINTFLKPTSLSWYLKILLRNVGQASVCLVSFDSLFAIKLAGRRTPQSLYASEYSCFLSPQLLINVYIKLNDYTVFKCSITTLSLTINSSIKSKKVKETAKKWETQVGFF